MIIVLEYLKSTATTRKLSLKAFSWYRQEYQNCKVIYLKQKKRVSGSSWYIKLISIYIVC